MSHAIRAGLGVFIKAADEAEALLQENEELKAELAQTKHQFHLLQQNQAQTRPTERIADQARNHDMVYVGIDGDGYCFRKELIEEGYDGGQKAAELLSEHISDVVHDTLGHSDLPVLTQICAFFTIP